MTVTTEVVDDEDQHVVTAGSIITVTVMLDRGSLNDFMSDTQQVLDRKLNKCMALLLCPVDNCVLPHVIPIIPKIAGGMLLYCKFYNCK